METLCAWFVLLRKLFFYRGIGYLRFEDTWEQGEGPCLARTQGEAGGPREKLGYLRPTHYSKVEVIISVARGQRFPTHQKLVVVAERGCSLGSHIHQPKFTVISAPPK